MGYSAHFCWLDRDEIMLHGKERRRRSGRDTQLVVDVFDVVMRGAFRHHQLGANLTVGTPARHQPQDIDFARRKPTGILATPATFCALVPCCKEHCVDRRGVKSLRTVVAENLRRLLGGAGRSVRAGLRQGVVDVGGS